ncbi:MAG TPA: medium chain dehydrogenase/reductase family protein [Thermoanaerobaculia bacterium]|nr:medium chain dehydrogenase/reductase family protein [Thermoanaerobaculia bacterium]
MRQAWVTRHGGPEVLQVREAPDPPVGEGEVRIRVAAAGVNFADVLARIGLYPDAPKPPCVLGYEVAGEVDAVGPGEDGFRVGDRVLAITHFGGYASTVVEPAMQVVPLPAGLDFPRAAAIPVNYMTAWLMLVRMGNVQAGEQVLVRSAAGGVGQAAVQICRLRGASVIGTASPSKHERLRQSGVAHCLDYRQEDLVAEVRRLTGGRGVDIALDAVGGRSFRDSYRCLAPLGRLMVFGMSSFAPGRRRRLLAILKGLYGTPRFHPMSLINRNRGVFGLNIGHLWQQAGLLRTMLDEIVRLTAAGTFDPVVDRAFPLEGAGDAHAYLQERKNFGKVILTP